MDDDGLMDNIYDHDYEEYRELYPLGEYPSIIDTTTKSSNKDTIRGSSRDTISSSTTYTLLPLPTTPTFLEVVDILYYYGGSGEVVLHGSKGTYTVGIEPYLPVGVFLVAPCGYPSVEVPLEGAGSHCGGWGKLEGYPLWVGLLKYLSHGFSIDVGLEVAE